MTKVVFDISTSLDGCITAANVRADEPMGDGGERLHEWASGDDERSNELLAEAAKGLGAVICGRNTYDHSVPWWGADGPTVPARKPVFVVTHSEPEEQPETGVYTFVTHGIGRALEEASGAADGRTVTVMGGADLGRQFITAGLVDEISLRIVPGLSVVASGCSTSGGRAHPARGDRRGYAGGHSHALPGCEVGRTCPG